MALPSKIKKPTGGAPPAPKPASASAHGKRFGLLIGDEGAILVYMEGTKVVRRLFAPSALPTHTEAMVALMKTHPTVPVSLLIDCVDQQFVRQSFPPVSPLSVNGLVKRRLERDFQTEDIKGSLSLGRDKTGRKEWNILLIAIAKTNLLTSWIDLISEMPNYLSGLYLMPVEAPVYIGMLNKVQGVSERSEWQLLVTHNKVSGFRQVVINKNKLVFTRVTQAIDDAIPAVIAGNIEQEIINTIEYLRRLNFQAGSKLDITVVVSQEVQEVLDLKRFNLGNTVCLTPLQISDMLGLEQAALSADRFGDVVMTAAFLRAKKHTLRFSTAYIDSLEKLHKAKKALVLICALIALLFIGLSVSNLLDMQANNTAASETTTKHRGIKTKLTDLQKFVGGLNKNLAFKSAVVTGYDVFFKNAPMPGAFIEELAPLLSSDKRVISFDWSTQRNTLATLKPGAPVDPKKDVAKDHALKVTIEFDFRGAYPDVEELSRAETSFVEMLAQKMPNYAVEHEAFPWQKGGEKQLEISFDQKQDVPLKDGDTHLVVTFTEQKEAKAAPAKPPAHAPLLRPGAR